VRVLIRVDRAPRLSTLSLCFISPYPLHYSGPVTCCSGDHLLREQDSRASRRREGRERSRCRQAATHPRFSWDSVERPPKSKNFTAAASRRGWKAAFRHSFRGRLRGCRVRSTVVTVARFCTCQRVGTGSTQVRAYN
jgi:hypothetical protein